MVAVRFSEYGLAVLTAVPPVAASYHFTVQPDAAVTPKSTEPEPHRALEVGLVGAAGTALTVPVTAVRDALSHPAALKIGTASGRDTV